MAKSRNDILFKFLADTKSLDKGTKKAKTGMQGLADGAKRLAVGFGVAFGAREIFQFGKDAVDAASDYNESINAVEVATGSAAQAILQLGEDAATAFGVSKTEVNEAAVAFAGFGEQIDSNNVSGVFEEFIGRATDFASVMNIDVSEALLKFQSGLAGETEPLRRYGIDISAAATQTFAYANGIAEAGKKLTEAQKVQARYGLLLEQTNKTAGDFANTQESVANQQKIANAQMEDASIELGKRLIPLQQKWNRALKFTAGALANVLEASSDSEKQHELMARQLFEATKEAAGLTGSYDDLINATEGATSAGRDWSGFWDFMLGRQPDIDKALFDSGSQFARIEFLSLQAAKGLGVYDATMGRIQGPSQGIIQTDKSLASIAASLRDIETFNAPAFTHGIPTNLIDDNLLPTVDEGQAIQEALERNQQINGSPQ